MPKEDMKNTAIVNHQSYGSFIYRRDNLFSFSKIKIRSSMRTFVNKQYMNKIVGSSQYSQINATGVNTNTLIKQMQTWYGCYYLPAVMHVVNPKDVPNGWTVYEYAQRKGVTYHEDWWKKGGYVSVKFDIVTIDSDGKEHLSYVNGDNYMNNGNCSMWVMEGAPLSKKDYQGNEIKFQAGDFIIYYADKSVNDDYTSGGLY